ncbi:MAG: antirestriction protein [Gammaproteobacteria bacterium]|nr:antirestriction protein [Gammaproteobacteria bacterium]|tara:strand:- start:548 stop:1060 length:513 start_codon:yes stop_codon:yes gene_type:complete
MTETRRIYVADLAAYNSNVLHGKWIEVSDDPDSIRDEIQAMLQASPMAGAEEHVIHDYEGFAGYPVAEYESIEALCQVADYLSKFPEFGGELLNLLGDWDEARRVADEGHCGYYASLADYAEELTEQCGEVPEHLAPYLDYESMGRDMELNGDLLVIEVGFERIHVFHNI